MLYVCAMWKKSNHDKQPINYIQNVYFQKLDFYAGIDKRNHLSQYGLRM